MNNYCNRTIKSSGYATDASNFIILTTGESFNLANRKAFNLILCQNIPIQSSNLPVLIQVNGINYPLLDKFGNNRILAAAAYNAGPGRVVRWESKDGIKRDAAMYVENIPFAETRKYVQNVLLYDAIYQKLLTGKEGALLYANEINYNY